MRGTAAANGTVYVRCAYCGEIVVLRDERQRHDCHACTRPLLRAKARETNRPQMRLVRGVLSLI